MIPSFFSIKIFAIHTKYSGSVSNGLIIPPRSCTTNHLFPLTVDCGDPPLLVEFGEEEAVDEGALAQARLPHHQQGEVEAPLHGLAVHLLRQRREADHLPAPLAKMREIVQTNS